MIKINITGVIKREELRFFPKTTLGLEPNVDYQFVIQANCGRYHADVYAVDRNNPKHRKYYPEIFNSGWAYSFNDDKWFSETNFLEII